MKRLGSSIIFINDQQQVLLFLRDDKPGLPYRNMWDVPGGHVEPDETPEQCIIREMKEEMNIDLQDFQLFCQKDFDDRIEFTYWKKANLIISEINLMEGQRLKWFTQQEAANTELACGFNEIVEGFYQILILSSL
ncbi:MAG: NUDIX domain-containing protein [Candidatus Cloacimonetes bacterium]|jgi:8-oxo-dGTP diphosphatase|nr:NUDIX domain-containing protein [Candidatus Cloacimonadota bacterium]